jgi:hypothetical protein
MATTLKAGDLRQILVKAGAKWTIDPNLKDTDLIRTYSTGGDLTKAIKATSVPRIDVTPYLKTITSNPFLLQLRINRGLVAISDVPVALQSPVKLNEPVAAVRTLAAVPLELRE